MKKTFIILAAGIILSCCSAVEPSESDIPAETEPVTEEKTAPAETTALVTTAAPTENTTTDLEEYERPLNISHEEKVPPDERAALDKLRAKYGKDFTFISRTIPCELWGGDPEVKPTTYYLMDDEGRRFAAYGKENCEDIISEDYAFLFHEDELFERSKEYIRSYTRAGKLWISPPYIRSVPFEAPADLTYDQFMAYFCNGDYTMYPNIILPEGEGLPEELIPNDPKNYVRLDGLEYGICLVVYYLPQEDYDRIEDVTYDDDLGVESSHLRRANE